ncbi:hypothetical protein ACFVJK_43265 [Streptomyces sp. NPDC127172]|uniref:zinc finger domain-containing protein n=1 Tax=Streptomyces sp. NPDC127172 TaxID=3345382 RepID=UPI00362B2A91
MTESDRWGKWRPQFRSGEETKRVRAWYRQIVCSTCNADTGRACRTASGHPTEHHRARRDAAGPLPYEQWRKEGLFQTPTPPTRPAILKASEEARTQLGIDQSLGDAVAIVSHVLANRLGLALGDEATLDQLDDAARTLALARGPIASADLVTVLAVQVAELTAATAGPHDDLDAVFTTRVRERVRLARQQRDAYGNDSE